MRKCVNTNGKTYKSNGKFEGKNFLYSTQGDQVYQSSLRVDVTTQLRGALACGRYLLETDEELEVAVRKIPKFQIGAVHVLDENTPKAATQNLLAFIDGVNTRIDAVTHTKRLKEVSEIIRRRINENAECLPKHPTTGLPMNTTQLKAAKEKVSSHNQKVKQGLEGTLISAGLEKGTAEWSMKYGEGMGINRIQVSMFSVRIRMTIRHNLFEEFSEANYTDDPANADYHIAKYKKHSDPRTYTVDIPVTSVKQLQAIYAVLDDINKNIESILDEVLQKKGQIILLGYDTDRTEDQIKHDQQLAESLGAVLSANAEENRQAKLEAQAISILGSILTGKPIVSEDNNAEDNSNKSTEKEDAGPNSKPDNNKRV